MSEYYVVYQAYGKVEILNEVLVSISSLFKVTEMSARPKVVVYTDSVAYLADFLPKEIVLIEVLPSQWEAWKGKLNFVHRAKIEMLRFFSRSHVGSVLYCDTDTYFLADPISLFQKIENGGLIMHLDEGALRNSKNLVFKKLEKFLRSYRYLGQTIPSETHMWNAGVLGFSTSDITILDEVIALSDDLFSAYQKHVMEQLAFSVCFQRRNRYSCEAQIFHYWDFKEYRSLLEVFFKQRKGKDFAHWSHEIEKYTPMEMYRSKQAFFSKPYLVRKISKFFGKAYRLKIEMG